jgi:2-oxoglutarate dehydrogenase E1 component
MVQEGIISEAAKKEMENRFIETYNQALDQSRTQEISEHSWKLAPYEKVKVPEKWGKVKDTGVPVDHLKDLAPRLFDLSNINAHT